VRLEQDRRRTVRAVLGEADSSRVGEMRVAGEGALF